MIKKRAMFTTLLACSLTLFNCSCGNNPKPDPDPPGPTPPDPPAPVVTHNVTWDLDNGTDPIVETYVEGETPSYKYDIDYKEGHNEEYGYLFESWDKPLAPVTEDVTYKAIYSTEEYLVVTSAIVFYLNKKNADHFEFHYTGKVKKVDWGDGTVNDKNTHTYVLPEGPETYPTFLVKIYGNLSSISFGDENGVYSNANLAIKCVNLASTITSLPNNAFNGLYVANSFLLTKNIKYVGKGVFPSGLAKDCLIFTAPGISFEGWDEEWNSGGYRVVENIKNIGIEEDMSNPGSFFGYLIQKQDAVDYLAVSSYFTNDKNNILSITVPDKIDGKYVNAIIYNPFAIAYKLTELKLETSQLLYIGVDGLKKGNMSAITLPKTVIEIGENGFSGCTKLTSFDFNDNTSLTTINANAFRDCNQLAGEFKIPSSVNYIGAEAFEECRKLQPTNLENTSITEIKNGTFYECTEMTKIAFPPTLDSIGEDAFHRCLKLADIDATRLGLDIPSCASGAFDDLGEYLRVPMTITVSDEFASDAAAKEAFVAKGWPDHDKVTYKVGE